MGTTQFWSMKNKAMKALTLRQAHTSDIPLLALLAREAFWATFTGMMPEAELQRYIAGAFRPECLLAEFEETGTLFILAYSGEVLAGYAKISEQRKPERKEPQAYIELERLYLLKAYQGRKIGTMLMGYCVGYAREKRFPLIWLLVWERNTEAIGFYRRWGFEEVDRCIRMRGNDAQNAVWMMKHL